VKKANVSANITVGDFARAKDETFNRFEKYLIERHKSIGKLSIILAGNLIAFCRPALEKYLLFLRI